MNSSQQLIHENHMSGADSRISGRSIVRTFDIRRQTMGRDESPLSLCSGRVFTVCRA